MKYELVVLLDPKVGSDEIENLKNAVEALVAHDGSVIEKDDMGLMDSFHLVKGVNRPYYYSLYVELNPKYVRELKNQLAITKGVLRYEIFSMGNEPFFIYKDLEKKI